jgi:hypothetical protein
MKQSVARRLIGTRQHFWQSRYYDFNVWTEKSGSHRELSPHGPPRLHENHAEVFVSDYSYRSATMGSTFAARRAGT